MLHRNIDGPIGHGFPNTFYYENSAPLEHSDPDVDNELFNEQNKPVIISKKIGNGRFFLSSMWHMQDNAGVKKTLCTTLLNLQNQSKYFQLQDVLKTMVSAYGDQGITEAVVMSNSDKFITKDNLSFTIDPALFNAAVEVPRVKTINLLDGGDYIPPIFNLNSQEYYGSSYGLWSISDHTGGVFFSARVKYRGLDSIFSRVVVSSTNGSLLSDSSLVSQYEGITLPSAEQFVFMKPLVGSTIQFFFKTIKSGTVIIKIFNLAGKEITGRSWTANLIAVGHLFFHGPELFFYRWNFLVDDLYN